MSILALFLAWDMVNAIHNCAYWNDEVEATEGVLLTGLRNKSISRNRKVHGCGAMEEHSSTDACILVVCHVAGRGTELGVALDHLVDGIQKVLLCRNLRMCLRTRLPQL